MRNWFETKLKLMEKNVILLTELATVKAKLCVKEIDCQASHSAIRIKDMALAQKDEQIQLLNMELIRESMEDETKFH